MVEPFGYGTKYESTCCLGHTGRVSLIKPENLNDEDFGKYVTSCVDVCNTECLVKDDHFCCGIDYSSKTAHVDAFEENVKYLLEEYNTHCFRNLIQKSDE